MTRQEARTADPDRAGIDVLVFRAGATSFCVCIDQILEIEEVEEFVRVTSADETLRGALLARGRPMPMIDVARRLGLSAATRYAAPALLITVVGGTEVGFLVDDPEDVTTLAPEAFRGIPEIIKRTIACRAVFALALWGARILVCLDLPALVTQEEARLAGALAREAFPVEVVP